MHLAQYVNRKRKKTLKCSQDKEKKLRMNVYFFPNCDITFSNSVFKLQLRFLNAQMNILLV